jgi:hypothetical protein
VPVTARLSKRFYDQFGDETVNELVNLLNAMDTTYRDDLKEINNLNFARFDAKLEQRFAEQDAKIDKRFAEQDAKFDKRFAALEKDLEKRFGAVNTQFGGVNTQFAAMEARIERTLREHTRWMVGCWLSVMLAFLALWTRG